MPTLFIKSATKIEELPKSEKPQVALVGRSNVGKSSLLNHLTGQKGLARESAEPGRTQLINVFEVDHRFFLIDLPGYGFAKASKVKREGFHDMVRDYLWQAQQLKLVLLIIDGRHGPSDLDRDMMGYLTSGKIPFVLIVNKIDKLSNSESIGMLQQLEASFPTIQLIPHSSLSNIGRAEIRQAIDEAVRIG